MKREGRFMPNFGKLVPTRQGNSPASILTRSTRGLTRPSRLPSRRRAESTTAGILQEGGDRAEGYLGTQGQDTPGQGTGNQ